MTGFCFSCMLLLLNYIYLRYAEYHFESEAKIEIIDKAQDSEMALPTAMTVFNRSMINLENEIGVLNSYTLHSKVVKDLKSNIKYYSIGNIKDSELHHSEFYKDYDLSFKNDLELINEKSSYEIIVDKNKLHISKMDNSDERIKEYSFKSLSTLNIKNDLPFNLTINKFSNGLSERILVFNPFESTVNYYKGLFRIEEERNGSGLKMRKKK